MNEIKEVFLAISFEGTKDSTNMHRYKRGVTDVISGAANLVMGAATNFSITTLHRQLLETHKCA